MYNHWYEFGRDPGSKYDEFDWDTPETLPIFVIDGYPYMASSQENADLLYDMRQKIKGVCRRLRDYPWETEEEQNMIRVFLGLHDEKMYDEGQLPRPFSFIVRNGHPSSRYLLSELPRGTDFSGINKPRMRYESNSFPVGTDGTGRALYRHIFLNLREPKLTNLLIHELAHSMANHIQWRPDDHGRDFKLAERIIRSVW